MAHTLMTFRKDPFLRELHDLKSKVEELFEEVEKLKRDKVEGLEDLKKKIKEVKSENKKLRDLVGEGKETKTNARKRKSRPSTSEVEEETKAQKVNGVGQKNDFAHCVGRRVGVWWKGDSCYYYGTVLRHDERTGMCEIEYEDGEQDWLDLSAEKLDWREKGATVIPTTFGRRFWSKEEDKMLTKAVQEWKGKVKVLPWIKIAEKVPGRNSEQCCKRWAISLNPDVKKGPWTQQEDAILLEAHQKFGDSWAEISKLIPGRTCKAVRNRLSRCVKINASLKSGPWVAQEDKALYKAYKEIGKKWSEVSKLIPGRTDRACMARWHCKIFQEKFAINDD